MLLTSSVSSLQMMKVIPFFKVIFLWIVPSIAEVYVIVANGAKKF